MRWLGNPVQYAGTPLPTTDAQGRITLRVLAGSSTVVHLSRASTFLPPMTIQVPAGSSDMTLTLPVLSTLAGRLSDSKGRGVVGAALSLSAGSTSAETTTDLYGRYAFAAPDGPYQFEASFSRVPEGAFEAGQLTGDVAVAGGTTLSATLPAAAALDVRLRHTDGTPATEASVLSTTSATTLTSSAGTHLEFSSRYRELNGTDADGLVHSRAFAGTQVSVEVAVPDQGRITGIAEMSTDPTVTTTATVTVAQPTATVSGVVRDEEGAPVAGAQVSIRSVGSNTGTSATTGVDGAWNLKVVPGTVILTAQRRLPGVTYSVHATTSFDVLSTATLDVPLPTAKAFVARLVDASGQPVTGVREFLAASSTTTLTQDGVTFEVGAAGLGEDRSDASGQLTMHGLPGTTASGTLQQADGYTFPFEVEVPSDSTPVEISMPWIGSVPSHGADAGRVGIAGPPGTTLSQLSSEPATTTPDGQTALVGNVGYTLAGVEPGSTNNITLTLPSGSQPTRVFKVAEDGTTTDATDHATITGSTIVLRLTDGGFGDTDGVANGVIVDPVVPTRAAATATPAAVPVTAPTVVGTARVGSTLTARPGTWAPSGVTPAYQWLVDGRAVSGATRPTYVLPAATLGKRVSVRVTAAKPGYTAGISNSSATPAVGYGVIVQAARPSVAGTRRVGSLLTVRPGAWAPAVVTVRYVWLRDNRAFTGVTTQSRYRQTKRDRGHRISVRVIVSKAGYRTRVVTTTSAITR